MASIAKMTVQGIRSFGPDDKDKGIIQFFKPLTLILGQNGSGKTTIIECLNYAATGELPPLAKKDGSFIHDPKLARETKIRGVVKLQFTDSKGGMKCIQRSMEATQKANSISCKTLDSAIVKKMPDGELVQIDTRCIELNAEMITSLGVNKSVMTNVIFCHQEESNWPLSDGKALKTKFDEIFNAVKYTKVLESLSKKRKALATDIKLHQTDMRHLKLNKERAASIMEEQRNVQNKLTTCQTVIAEKNASLEPLQQELTELVEKANEIYNIEKKITGVKEARNQIQKHKEDIRKNIKNEYTGSLEDLELDIRNYNRSIDEQRRNLKLSEDRLYSIKEDCEHIRSKISDKLIEKGKLETELQRHEAATKQRDELMQSVAIQHQFQGFSMRAASSVAGGEAHMKRFFTLLSEKRKRCEADMARLKAEFDEAEAQLQRTIHQYRDGKSKAEQTYKVKHDMLTTTQAEMRTVNQQLGEISAPSGRLDEINRLLREAERKEAEEKGRVDAPALQVEIDNLEAEKKRLDAQLRLVNDAISVAGIESEARSELRRNRSERSDREEQVRRLRQRHDDSLQHLLGCGADAVPLTALTDTVTAIYREREENARALQQKVQEVRVELSRLDANRISEKNQLDEKYRIIKEFEDVVSSTFGSQDFDFSADAVQRSIDELQDEKGQLDAMSIMYNKWVSQLGRTDPCCPTCERRFDSEGEVTELVRLLQRKKNMLPQKQREKAEHLRKKTADYHKIIELRPQKEQVSRLQEEDVPRLLNSLKDTANKVEKLKQKLEETDELYLQEQSDTSLAQELLPDMTMVDKYYGEVKELQRKITVQEAQLSTQESKSSEELKHDKDEVESQVDVLGTRLEQKKRRKEGHQRALNELQTRVITLKQERLDTSRDLDRRQQLEGRRAELSSQCNTLNTDIKEAKAQIRPIECQIQAAEEKKKEKVEQKDNALKQSRDEIVKLQNLELEVQRIDGEVQRFLLKGGHDKLHKSETDVVDLQEELREKDVQKTDLEIKIQDISKQISAHEVNERELQDNKRLRDCDKQIEDKSNQIVIYRQKIAKYDVDNLQRQKERLERGIKSLMQEVDIKQGAKLSLLEQVRRLEQDLDKDEHRDAARKHRNALIDLRVAQIASRDIERYYKALDNAVMSYHHTKMKEINKIIRNLWKTIYQGTDIDCIEIRTDEGTGNMTRRTFNYRVVMVKGDTVLDMRGRCSAGQKVVASIIIRLALAETFCGQCGILTLDEPTTNLDHDNIRSLSRALADLVASRADQQNFQLVIITHDEDFVASFNTSNYVEHFYRVSKNPNSGLSRIERRRIRDLADQ